MTDLSSLLAELRAGEADGFEFVDREAVYHTLGIASASDVDNVDLSYLSPQETEELRNLVMEIALSGLPILYPSDQHYLDCFEGIDLTGRIQILRSDLGYFHYFTRTTVLARLRGSMFADLLSCFDRARQRAVSHEDMISTLLENVAPNIRGYSNKVREVLAFSFRDDLDEQEIEILSRKVMESVLGFLLTKPRTYLEAPSALSYWRQYIVREEPASLARRTLQQLPANLEVLFDKWDCLLKGEPVPEDLERRYQFLIESSWYRYFFFDERGLETYMRHGSTGFQDLEVYDDFIEKLGLLDTWKLIELPGGELEDDLERVRSARQVGTYVVRFRDGSKTEVEVAPLPGMGIDDLRSRIQRGDLELSSKLHLFVTDEGCDSYILRRRGESRSVTGPIFKLDDKFVAIVRLTKPGRYEVLSSESDAILGTLDTSVTYREPPVIEANIPEGTVTVRTLLELRLVERPSDSGIPIEVHGSCDPDDLKVRVQLIDTETGVYSIEVEGKWKLSPFLCGAEIIFAIPSANESVGFRFPAEFVVMKEGTRFRLLEHQTTVEPDDEFLWYVAGNTPVRWVLSEGEHAVIEPGSSGRLRTSQGVFEWSRLEEGRSAVFLHAEGRPVKSIVIQGGQIYRIRVRSGIQLFFNSPFHSHRDHIHFAPLRPDLAMTVTGMTGTSEEVLVRIEAPDGSVQELVAKTRQEQKVPVDIDTSGRYLYTVQINEGQAETFVVYHVLPPLVRLPLFLEVGSHGTAHIELPYPVVLESVRAQGCNVNFSPSLGLPATRVIVSMEPFRASGSTELVVALSLPEIRDVGVVHLVWRLPIVNVNFLIGHSDVDNNLVVSYADEPVRVIISAEDLEAEFVAQVGEDRFSINVSDLSGTEIPVQVSQEDHIQVQVFALVDDKEIPLKSVLNIHRDFIPRVSLPDGIWYVPGEPLPVVLSPFRPGLELSVEQSDGTTETVPVPSHGLVWITVSAERGRLAVLVRGKEELDIFYGTVRRSINLQSLKVDSTGAAIFAPTASGKWALLKLLKNTSLIDIDSLLEGNLRSFRIIGVYLPSFRDRLTLCRHLASQGAGLYATQGTLPLIRFYGKDLKPRLIQEFELDQVEDSTQVLLVDAAETPDILSPLLENDGRWVVLLNNATLGYGQMEELLVQRLVEGLLEGDLVSFDNLGSFRERLDMSERTALRMLESRDDMGELIIRGLFQLLDDPDTLKNEQACKSLSQFLRSSRSSPQFTGAISVRIINRVSASIESVMDASEKVFDESIAGIRRILEDIVEFPLGVDIRYTIERKVFDTVKDAKRNENWDVAFLGLQRLRTLFPAEARYLIDEAAMHYEFGAWTEDGTHRREMVRLVNQARSMVSGPANLMVRYPDIYIERLLSEKYHDCGYLVWISRDRCPHCGKTYEAKSPE